MNVVVMGLGEVGKAICDICEEAKHKVYVIEKTTRDDIPNNETIDVMLINIPFSDEFLYVTSIEVEELKPKLVIINSTVDVGITRKLEDISGVNVVHSPIRGVHPRLKEGIKTFVKYVGATDPDKSDMAVEFLEGLGLNTKAFNSPEETEIGKLLSTTTYAAYIEWATEMERICKENNVDYKNVYVDWNMTYNIGYMALGMPEVVRPILKPCKDGVGGHCIIENCGILYRNKSIRKSLKPFLALGKSLNTMKEKDKPYRNYEWLLCEYYGKEKNSREIANECGVSDVTIQTWLYKFNIDREVCIPWSEEEDEQLTELSQEMSFLEISEQGMLDRSYEAIRIRASKLDIKSPYKPGEMTKDFEIRKKISCKLQDISPEEFDGFTTTENEKIRRSLKYKVWRQEVFRRDGYICKKCGEIGGHLHAHHIKPFSKNIGKRFNIDNGMTYCKDCHMYIIHKFKKS